METASQHRRETDYTFRILAVRQPNVSSINHKPSEPIQGRNETMDKNVILHLAIFVGLLLALNFFFHLHISIIGSLLLTLGLNFAMGMIQSKR